LGLRTTISERQRRLGQELKRLREQADLTAGEAAQQIGMGRGQLSHIETGRTTILTPRLRDLCRTYGAEDETYVDALVAMSESTGKGWWSAYKNRIGPGALDLAELESTGTNLHSHQSLFIPGLLQTEDYTRAIVSTATPTYGTVEDAVAFRMRRQQILTGDHPATLHAVIHEAALHMRFGGPRVMRAQLLHLVAMAQLPHVTIQIFPFDADAYAAYTGTFLHITPVVRQLGTVILEHPVMSLHLTESGQLAEYKAFFDTLTKHSLAPIDPHAAAATHQDKDSLALIQHLLYTL
jgi:transcriptional regulator with XRE-family HTH domain